jgi:hypothetical protein
MAGVDAQDVIRKAGLRVSVFDDEARGLIKPVE